jgi:hypothetical protein
MVVHGGASSCVGRELGIVLPQAAFAAHPRPPFLGRRDMALLQAIKRFPQSESDESADRLGTAQEVIGQRFGRAVFEILRHVLLSTENEQHSIVVMSARKSATRKMNSKKRN